MNIDSKISRPPTAVRGRGETILVIEDEPGVREMVRMLLESRGFRALVAEDGPDGLALYRQHQQAVKAIITDMRMPAMHGVEVIHELRQINPDARIVAMSGVVEANLKYVDEPGRLVHLPKPMTSSELVIALQSVLVKPAEIPQTASLRPFAV